MMLIVFVSSSFMNETFAQNTITGTVTDSSGEPLPGVNIIKVGTTIGTETNFDGDFSIEVTKGESLSISFIGMKTIVILIEDQTILNITMEEDANALEEIVVMGYGTQKRTTLTGSVSTVSGEKLEKSASPNLGSALAGKVAGLYIDTNNNTPGADNVGIRIRGTNTFNNSSALVVIDGIPNRAGGLARLNPADIESITILKDASAAIYGARAANGVILVTTKRGKKGPAKIKITSNYGFQNFSTTPDMLTGAEYMDLINVLNVYKLPTNEWSAANAVRGTPFTRPNGEVLNPSYSTERIDNTAAGTDLWNYPDTDWMEEVISNNAPIVRHNAQISGGGETMNYLGSVSYLKQDVNFKNAPKGFTQFDMRLNLDAKISEHLKLNIGLYSRQEDNLTSTRGSGVLDDLIRQYPWFPAFWPTGEYGPDIENGNNPAIRVTGEPGYTETNTNYVQSNMGLTFKVPGVEGLELKGSFSYDKQNYDYKNWNQPWTLYTWDGVNNDSSGLTPAQRGPQNPDLTQRHFTRTDMTATINATYEKQFGDHYLKLLGGITREESEVSNFEAFRRNFLSSEIDELKFGGNDGQNNTGTGYETARLNYYGRVNYTYKDKYLLEFLFRYDGSYLFPEDNRFGFFPGASGGWIVSEETFFKEALPIFDFFKIRVSYGKMGNDHTSAFQYLAGYGSSATGLESVVSTVYETKVANPNITWETATSTNIGFDLKMFDRRLSVGFDYFNNTREDILTQPAQTLPGYTGITPPDINLGEFSNKGYEITIGYRGETSYGLTYGFDFNFSDSSNKLVFFDEPELADRPWQRQQGGEIGRPLKYRFIGVFRTQADIDASTIDYSGVTPALKPGDAMVQDVNGDGKITPDDRTRVGGSPFADTQFGFNTNLSYKNFDFSMFWTGGIGAYNTYEWSFMSGTLANVQRDVRDRAWSIDNPNAPYPRLADRGDQWYSGQTDYALITRDYVRMKNLEVGYNFVEKVCNYIGADDIRISIIGTNLITITDFPFDPEVAQGGVDVTNTRNAGGGALNNGQAYPMLKTIMGGIQLTF